MCLVNHCGRIYFLLFFLLLRLPCVTLELYPEVMVIVKSGLLEEDFSLLKRLSSHILFLNVFRVLNVIQLESP